MQLDFFQMTIGEIHANNEVCALMEKLTPRWERHRSEMHRYAQSLVDAKRFLQNPTGMDKEKVLFRLRSLSKWMDNMEAYQWSGNNAGLNH